MLTLLSFNLCKFVTADRVCFTHREGGREGKIESRRKRGSHPSLTYLGKLLGKLILIGSLESMSRVLFPKY